MNDTMTRYLSGITEQLWQRAIRAIFVPIVDRMSTQPLNSAGLVIHGSASALAKTGASVFYASVTGILVKIAASTDMPALVGTVTNATFNAFAFFVDAAGTVTAAMGTQGATLAAMKLPPFPLGKALVGFIVINPTGTGDFVGGTTALDDGTVVPNAAYVSPIGPFDPTVLV